jgi:hypothetical protein
MGIVDGSTEVKIIQKWNGWALRDFRRNLIQEKINDTFKATTLKRKRSNDCYPTNHTTTTTTTTSHSIHRIYMFLETLIEEGNK